MSGPIHANAPWAREGLRQLRHTHPEVVARIEEAIPDGHSLNLAAGGKSGRYGIWVGILMRDGTHRSEEVARSPESMSRSQALEMAIHAGKVAAA